MSLRTLNAIAIRLLSIAALGLSLSASADWTSPLACNELEHGGGLNACGCHFNRKTGECHCHQPRGCGCPCQAATCK